MNDERSQTEKNKMIINKQSPLPIYWQIEQFLREQIEETTLQPGDLLPSEREYAEQFQISRMTVRQAMANLVSEGLLSRQKGRGTFVAKQKTAQQTNGLTSFTEDMKARGMKPASQLLFFELVPAAPGIAGRLQISEHEPVYKMARIRLADNEPMALETAYLPGNLVKGLTESIVAGSLYRYIEADLNLAIGRAVQSVEAANATEREHRYLGVSPSAPVLIMERTAFLQDGQPFEYVKSCYRADRYKLSMDLNR